MAENEQMKKWRARPLGSNADEWALFLSEHEGATEYLAVQIAEAIEARADTAEALLERAEKMAGLIARFEPSEGLSPSALGHLQEVARAFLDKLDARHD